jgi:Holliday junction resolvase RusA-like endonuclease
VIEIVLLGRPVAKGRPRFNRESGRAYTPEKTRTYEQMLRLAAADAMSGKALLDGPLRVHMHVVVPIAPSWPRKKQEAARVGDLLPVSKPDWENYGKVLDAANLVVWVDDSQVCDGRITKVYGDKPGMWVWIDRIALPWSFATPPQFNPNDGVFA